MAGHSDPIAVKFPPLASTLHLLKRKGELGCTTLQYKNDDNNKNKNNNNKNINNINNNKNNSNNIHNNYLIQNRGRQKAIAKKHKITFLLRKIELYATSKKVISSRHFSRNRKSH